MLFGDAGAPAGLLVPCGLGVGALLLLLAPLPIGGPDLLRACIKACCSLVFLIVLSSLIALLVSSARWP